MIHNPPTPAASWMILVACLALFLAPGTANAHELEPQRSVVAQVDDTSLSIMLVYEEVPGPRSDLLLARYDLNGDGKIEGQETILASREMIARMLAGIQFEVDFDTPRGHSPEIRFKVGPKGEVSAAAFIRYELAPLSALPLPANRNIHVRLIPGPNNIPTEVLAIASPGIRLLHVFHPPDSATKDGASLLSAGEQWTAIFMSDSTTVHTKDPATAPPVPPKTHPARPEEN